MPMEQNLERTKSDDELLKDPSQSEGWLDALSALQSQE